jgi:predicted house-cleaning noncanonical NTP pyrophosphatase (MazG superfamily)
MTKNFEELDDAFNVTSEIVPTESSEVGITKPERHVKTDIEKDYDYTRGNLYSIIEKGQEAINGILELAQESEMPRAYEVAGQLIKSVSDATDKLMDLQKKLKDVEEEKASKGPSTVNNALFVGSTAELAKMLKSANLEDNK